MATDALAEAGFDAAKLSEGIVGWDEADLPLEPEGGTSPSPAKPPRSCTPPDACPLVSPPEGASRAKYPNPCQVLLFSLAWR